MRYYTADTYKNWERVGSPYNKNGKLYTSVKCECDRCTNGIYAIGVENGHIKPHPNYGGICLKCGGSGFLNKEVRLYTASEYNSMKNRQLIEKERKEALREQKMKEEYANNKAAWLKNNNFSKDGYTYIVTGDSYSIKDQLKENGFKYDLVLKWHRATAEGYEDQVIKVSADDIIEFSAWGKGYYKTGAKETIENKLAETQLEDPSNWVGEEGAIFEAESVQLISKNGFESYYGYSNIYTFRDENCNKLVWFTKTNIPFVEGDHLKIKGRIKSHEEYKGTKQTILTRCKVEEAV